MKTNGRQIVSFGGLNHDYHDNEPLAPLVAPG
jgi:hypothetical protein